MAYRGTTQANDRRDTMIGVRVTEAEKAALEAVAKAEDRPVSVLVRKVVMDWLRRLKT